MPWLMDMPIDSVTMGDAVQRIFAGLAAGRGGTVITPNIDILRQYRSSPEMRSVFEHTNLLVADGMPLVVALRVQRTPVPRQITGTDLLWTVTAEAVARGYSVLLAGGHPGDAQRAADRLGHYLPDLHADTYPCFVSSDTEADELAGLSRALIAAAPDVVFLGLPFRTQVAAMTALREKLPTTWFVGVGSSFELVSGDRARPPVFVQRLCLEWAWRLRQQPALWRRYLIDGMPTVARLGVSALRVRFTGRRDDVPQPALSPNPKDPPR